MKVLEAVWSKVSPWPCVLLSFDSFSPLPLPVKKQGTETRFSLFLGRSLKLEPLSATLTPKARNNTLVFSCFSVLPLALAFSTIAFLMVKLSVSRNQEGMLHRGAKKALKREPLLGFPTQPVSIISGPFCPVRLPCGSLCITEPKFEKRTVRSEFMGLQFESSCIT